MQAGSARWGPWPRGLGWGACSDGFPGLGKQCATGENSPGRKPCGRLCEPTSACGGGAAAQVPHSSVGPHPELLQCILRTTGYASCAAGQRQQRRSARAERAAAMAPKKAPAVAKSPSPGPEQDAERELMETEALISSLRSKLGRCEAFRESNRCAAARGASKAVLFVIQLSLWLVMRRQGWPLPPAAMQTAAARRTLLRGAAHRTHARARIPAGTSSRATSCRQRTSSCLTSWRRKSWT